MHYKIIERDSEIFFKYKPEKNQRKIDNKIVKESPFKVLKDLNLG